jgi:ABC-2 type transport system permease protein
MDDVVSLCPRVIVIDKGRLRYDGSLSELVHHVRQLTGSWLVWEMNEDIRSGGLSQKLLKPIHPLLTYSAENLAALPLRAALAAPVAVVALVVSGGDKMALDPGSLAIFALSLLGAWVINFFIMALIGTLAFYLESSSAIFEVYLASFMILSGYLVPLSLFPPWLQSVSDALPFRYTLAFPVETITGLIDRSRALRDLGVQWAYAVVVAWAALASWRRGVQRFSAFGG